MQSLPKKSLLPFTEEHEAFRKEFGEFLDREIVPYYMDMEKNHSVGKETFKKFGDAGYGCLWLEDILLSAPRCRAEERLPVAR